MAQGLFFSKGYEQTSVQEIIRTIGVAKGTFYHYFDSKLDILEAIIERIAAQITVVLQGIIDDERLNPHEKLEQFFIQANQWKAARKDQLITTGRVIYMNENVLLRERLMQAQTASFVPMIAQVIEEGNADGSFNTEYPVEVAELILVMVRVLGESIVRLLLEPESDTTVEQVTRQINACNQSIERVLGMQPNTLTLFDADALNAWFS